jgi:hypothetical protein
MTKPKAAPKKAATKPENTKAPAERTDATDQAVAPLIDPTDVPNMTRADIQDATAGGLDEDTGPKRDAAEGLAQASDKMKDKAPEPNPFAAGPGSDVA